MMSSTDTVALEFLNSAARVNDRDTDLLDSGAGLLAWLQEAGVVPANVLEAVRSGFAPVELDKAAAEARSLREWFRTFVHAHKGQDVGEGDLRELGHLNTLLERDDIYSQLVGIDSESTGLGLQVRRRWHSPELLLVAIAQSLAAFVCNADFSHVKQCEGPGCPSIIADEARGPARRWCKWCPDSSL
jgi:predicted RNA-binding Zn ribbon-like protein